MCTAQPMKLTCKDIIKTYLYFCKISYFLKRPGWSVLSTLILFLLKYAIVLIFLSSYKIIIFIAQFHSQLIHFIQRFWRDNVPIRSGTFHLKILVADSLRK
jgi:hypothetical protein